MQSVVNPLSLCLPLKAWYVLFAVSSWLFKACVNTWCVEAINTSGILLSCCHPNILSFAVALDVSQWLRRPKSKWPMLVEQWWLVWQQLPRRQWKELGTSQQPLALLKRTSRARYVKFYTVCYNIVGSQSFSNEEKDKNMVTTMAECCLSLFS